MIEIPEPFKIDTPSIEPDKQANSGYFPESSTEILEQDLDLPGTRFGIPWCNDSLGRLPMKNLWQKGSGCPG